MSRPYTAEIAIVIRSRATPRGGGQHGRLVRCSIQTRRWSRCCKQQWRREPATCTSSVGRPPTARRDGTLVPFEGVAVLTPPETERIVFSLARRLPAQGARRGATGRLLVRHRGPRSLPCQRLQAAQHIALALRVIPFRVRSLEELGAPVAATDLLNKPYGLVLVVGPTGSGKSTTLAAMIDRINADAAGAHPHHRGPGRVPAQPQDGDGQPARGRHRRASASPMACAAPFVKTPTSSCSAKCATSTRSPSP